MSEQAATPTALVIGAGIVGTCCAAYLQRAGFHVDLVDRDAPGQGCSSGSAGTLAIDSCVPFALPGFLFRLPGMLIDPRSPLVVALAHAPRALPHLWHVLQATRRRRVEEIVAARMSILVKLFDAFEPLLSEAGVRDLMVRGGRLVVRDGPRALAVNSYADELRRTHGISMVELDRQELLDREPCLGPRISSGIYFPDAGHTPNPLRLTTSLVTQFVRRGGRLLNEDVKGIEVGADQELRVVTNVTTRVAQWVVLAAGVWSKSLARQMGASVPLVAERGYHMLLPDPGVRLQVPVASADRMVAIVPMEMGIRVSGIAEIADPDRPPAYRHARRVLRLAQEVIPALRTAGATPWMGCRPSTPDFLPVLGPSPRHPRLLFAFGHGHTGLTLAAITGKLIAEIASGLPTSVDLTPFLAERF